MSSAKDLELIHYSQEPLTLLLPNYPHSSRDTYFKPQGLWVSVRGENDWPAWCESEDFRIDTLVHATRIMLSGKANILLLSGADMIDAFTGEYQLEKPRYKGDRSIDWPLVAQRFDGIVIAPYCWSRRMTEHTFWYYGWDCASGCIWNTGAVSELLPVVLLVRVPSEAAQ